MAGLSSPAPAGSPDGRPEGPCAQVLHVGPYADEAPRLELLDAAIRDEGCAPRGRHHEIYLGDPRRSAPEKLRTLLRHAVDRLP